MEFEFKTVGELKVFLEGFDDSAQIGLIIWPYGGMVTKWYLMQDFEDEGIENPCPVPYPTLVAEYESEQNE
jgi:hypothetical protein